MCAKSYTTVASDLNKSAITNTATATGVDNDYLTLPTITASVTVANAAHGSITIVKNASGGDGALSFSSTVAGTTSFTLTTVSGTASRSFASLMAGTYTFTETNLPLHWRLTALACSGDTGGTPTTVNLTNGSVSIGLDAGESITCTFTHTFDAGTHRDQTLQVIRRFLLHRMSLMLSEQPDRARFLRRFPDRCGAATTHSPALRRSASAAAAAVSIRIWCSLPAWRRSRAHAPMPRTRLAMRARMRRRPMHREKCR